MLAGVFERMPLSLDRSLQFLGIMSLKQQCRRNNCDSRYERISVVIVVGLWNFKYIAVVIAET